MSSVREPADRSGKWRGPNRAKASPQWNWIKVDLGVKMGQPYAGQGEMTRAAAHLEVSHMLSETSGPGHSCAVEWRSSAEGSNGVEVVGGDNVLYGIYPYEGALLDGAGEWVREFVKVMALAGKRIILFEDVAAELRKAMIEESEARARLRRVTAQKQWLVLVMLNRFGKKMLVEKLGLSDEDLDVSQASPVYIPTFHVGPFIPD